MTANMLKLNDAKTEYLLIGSKQPVNNVSEKVNSLCIGDESVMASVSAKNIGVVTESTLNMSLQESNTCRSCYASL